MCVSECVFIVKSRMFQTNVFHGCIDFKEFQAFSKKLNGCVESISSVSQENLTGFKSVSWVFQ